jgi:hypothetical protein
VADIHRNVLCSACGKSHTLYDTSAVRHAPGDLYSYTCPVNGLVVEVRFQHAPEVVHYVPDDAIPVERVRD